MKAIYLIKYGNSNQAFEIRDTPIPDIEDNEVIIAVKSIGLNFADVLARRGLYPDAPKNPAVLGYDVAGTIHSKGKDVTHVDIGQRVAALTRFGGYTEYAKTFAEGVAAIPDNVSFEEATALATQGCTAYYCAEESVQLHEGDHVLIHAAAGGVGSLLVQYAKYKGCKVYGTASTKKQDFLRELGVDVPIDYTSQNFDDIISRDLKDGQQLDVIFDSIGGAVFKKGMKILGQGGRMVTYGAASQMDKGKKNLIATLKVGLGFGIFSPISLLMSSQAIISVNMLRIADHRKHIFKHVFEQVMDLTSKGVLKPKVGKVFPADQFAEAHEYLEQRKSLGKVVVNW